MKLLLAVDDSVHSERAVEALCHIDWLVKGSELSILNVVKPIDYLLPIGGGTDNTESKERELTRARGAWLDALAQKIGNKLPGLKVSHKVKFGDTRFVIINTAVSDAAELIVMGSQGRTGVERLILGSVSCSVVEYAPCPVLIVKGEPSSWGGFERVFVAFDGSAYSHDAIDWICARQWAPKTKVHVVMTLPEFDTVDAQNVSRVESGALKAQWTIINSKANQMLQDAAVEIGAIVGKDNVSVEAIPGDPRAELLKSATKFGASVIIMGSRGRTGLTKFLLGSVSLHLANHSPIPIVIVRRPAPKTQATLYAQETQGSKR